MKGNMFEYFSLSNIFDRVDKTHIGRKFFLHIESPALYADFTSDLFRLLGMLSSSKDLLTSCVISS